MLQAYYKGTNVKVKTGDVIRDFRGNLCIFITPTRKTENGRSGKVRTNEGEFYDKVFNLEVIEYDEYQEKMMFVMEELKNLLQAINTTISNVRYEYIRNNKIVEKETIIIEFINGYKKYINVTCESLKAIVKDIIKEI